MTIIKEDIIRTLSTSTKIEVKQSKSMIQALLKIIKDTFGNGDDILISGFGQFKIRHKRSRIGRNPKTKEEFQISERNVVTFFPSKAFRKELND
ncbi:HU family DNA-binding protein [bacterium]|nr:HU family DNA-binding protein [bacterium]